MQTAPEPKPKPATLDEAWQRNNRPADQLRSTCAWLLRQCVDAEYDQGDQVQVPYDELADVIEGLQAALDFAATYEPAATPTRSTTVTRRPTPSEAPDA